MRVAIIGGVTSTQLTLQKLVEHGMTPVRVYGYEPLDTSNVSGYVVLREYAQLRNLPYEGFRKVDEVEKDIVSQDYDIIFVVGLSQLVSEKILSAARIGCVGFHPTKLPLGRGRAPIAWMVVDQCDGAATFFVIGAGTDDGAILIQEPFEVSASDTAKTIEQKLLAAAESALDDWLPRLANGEWDPVPQNSGEATYYGKRTPADGVIDWSKGSAEIERLVRASSDPHPGAFFYFDNEKIIVWEARVEDTLKIKGVEGRVLIVKDDGEYLVQCGAGLIWISNLMGITADRIKVGSKLKIDYAETLVKLQRKVQQLEDRIKKL